MKALVSGFVLAATATVLGVFNQSIDAYLLRHVFGKNLITITIVVRVSPILWAGVKK